MAYQYRITINNKVVVALDADFDDLAWLTRELSRLRPSEWVAAKDMTTSGRLVILIEPTSPVSSPDADQLELS